MQTNIPNPKLEKKLLDQLQSPDVSEVEKALNVIHDQSLASQQLIQKLYELLDDQRPGWRVGGDVGVSVDWLAFIGLSKIANFRYGSKDSKSELKAFLYKKYPYLTEGKQTTESASSSSSKVESETIAKSLSPSDGNLSESSSTSPSTESREISSKKSSQEISQTLMYRDQLTEKFYSSFTENAVSLTPWLIIVFSILAAAIRLWFALKRRSKK